MNNEGDAKIGCIYRLCLLTVWFATEVVIAYPQNAPSNVIVPALDTTQTKDIDKSVDEKIIVTIYYRWDKDNLDKGYLSNADLLQRIDSILSLKSADYIDSMRIVAYASPEGNPVYNKKLSERRANTFRNYLLTTYPNLQNEQIITEARGENWEGFRRMAEGDANLPMKKKILAIINNSNITDIERQRQIAKLDDGRLYRNYILPKYYRYLRSGASLFVIYNPIMPANIDSIKENREVVVEEIKAPIVEPKIIEEVILEPKIVVRYPIAFRTNLLYDAVGAVNAGIEVPFGRDENWSLIVDGAYSYWRSRKNLYALQTLEYGAEARYWLGESRHHRERCEYWERPLLGWNVGAYGRCWQRYDAQWIVGYQGDGTWSAGLTAGYAFPIGRQLSFDASVGGGWLSTSQYRHYHRPENGNLMWQTTGKWSGFTLTKVRFSLVWLLGFRAKGGGC